MKNKNILLSFITLTFCIAGLVSGVLIVLSKFGYRVYGWITTIPQFLMTIPFSLYILSPAIASYIVLKKNHKTGRFSEWLKTVFYVKNNIYPYLFVVAGLVLYFSVHAASSGQVTMALPFYAFFLNLPGNLFIGGLEEAGWSYIMKPELDKKFSFILSSLIAGFIWALWHIPLFFIPGTGHGDGLIDFWMFTVQVFALRFFFGAIYKISGKSCVFMCVLSHTMFNAASSVFAPMTTTWAGTIAANGILVLVSIITAAICSTKQRQVSA